MSKRILHLNVNGEYFDDVKSGTREKSIESLMITGAKDLREENTMRSTIKKAIQKKEI